MGLISYFVVAKLLVDIDWLLLSELWQHLRILSVERPIVYNQFLRQNLFSDVVLRNHAFNGSVYYSPWLLLQK